MRRIYADFNNFDEHGNMPLVSAWSRKSIVELAEPLKDGDEVILSDGEVEMRAHVRWMQDGPESEWWGSYWEAYDVVDARP